MRTVALLMTMAMCCAAYAADGPAKDASPSPQAVKEPKLVSSKPLYLAVVFGEDTARKMLIVIDESQGDGKGYDSAIVDENMDGDLTNHAAVKFPRVEVANSASSKKILDPRVSFKGPLPGKKDANATYELKLYSLAAATSQTPARKSNYFFWSVTDSEKTNFFFINGQHHTYPTAAEALAGQPIVLAGKGKWSVQASQKGTDVAIAVALKDTNGCTLRVARTATGEVAPAITVVDSAGKELLKKKTLEYG